MNRRNALTKMIGAVVAGFGALLLPKAVTAKPLDNFIPGQLPGPPLKGLKRPDGSWLFYIEVPHEQAETYLAAFRQTRLKNLEVLADQNVVQIRWD